MNYPHSSCCDEEYSWIDSDLCAARSELTPLNKYWPDQQNGKCVKDSDEEAGDLSVPLFDTAEACCKERMNWVSLAKCVAESDGSTLALQGSGKYYVKNNKCVKDCAEGTGTDCGGLAETWEEITFAPSKSICCSTSLWWVERDECLA